MIRPPTPVAADQYRLFVQLLSRHVPFIQAWLRPLVLSQSAVDQTTEETSLRLWERFHEYAPTTTFLEWACSLAHVEALQLLHKHAHGIARFSDCLINLLATEGIAELPLRQREWHALYHCIRSLPPRGRNLLRNSFGDITATRSQIRKLTNCHRSGQTTAAEAARLELMLLRETAARRFFRRYLALDTYLQYYGDVVTTTAATAACAESARHTNPLPDALIA
jgi:DNA-directed RNA polymerase specialized sigma24 family protein